MKQIIINYVYPPIPTRQFDWCAYYDGEEEVGQYGYGSTKEESVKDLIENYEINNDE